LKIEGHKEVQITNQGLLEGFVGRDHYIKERYPEGNATYDPFKKRVV